MTHRTVAVVSRRALSLLLLLALLCSTFVIVHTKAVTTRATAAVDASRSRSGHTTLTPRQTLSLDGDAVLQLVREYEAAQEQQQRQQRKTPGHDPAASDNDDDSNSSSSSRGVVYNASLLILDGADKKSARRAVLLRPHGVVIALTPDHPAHRDTTGDDDDHDARVADERARSRSAATRRRCDGRRERCRDVPTPSWGVPAALGNYANSDTDVRGTLVMVTATLLCLLIALQLVV